MIERPRNAFLRALSDETFEALSRRLEPVHLSVGDYTHHLEQRIDWVYFPEGCVLSLITVDEDGRGVETSMVGTEGAGGILEACAGELASVECVAQIDGRAYRAPASFCRELTASDPGFNIRVMQIADLQMIECRQSGFCQASHTAEQRLARWLAESSDRALGRNPLPLTQEYVAALLGVQRTTVSIYASALQREGIIRYRRGQIEILDFPQLDRRACGCRSIMRRQRRRLGYEALSPAPASSAIGA